MPACLTAELAADMQSSATKTMLPPITVRAGGHLAMDEPDPNRAENRLERPEEGGEGRRDEAGAGSEEGKADAEIDHAESEQKAHVARRDPRGRPASRQKHAAKIVPRQVAGAIRTCANRRVMTVATET